ncbi:large subunit ribosomal protein L28 [Elusimicrobium simillimum]|uniref:50S ribosomal protein L28 n=1 Tax=Elusimicrobium simillimum TaxID=3143438 RepID=UPI003C6EEBEA
MSYKCELCGKGPVSGGSYSHSNKKTNRTFNPNLQKQKLVLDGKTQTAYVCTRCMKGGFVTKPSK